MNKESKKEILSMIYPLISRSLSSRDNQKAMLAFKRREWSPISAWTVINYIGYIHGH